MKIVDSLYFKIGVAMICVMAAAGIFSGYGISVQLKGQLQAQLVERANFTVHSLERAISPLIDNRNFAQMQKLVETIGAYRFIHRIFLIDRYSMVVASNDLFAIGQEKNVPIVKEVFEKNLLIRTADTENDITTAYPVRTEAYDAGSESDITHVLYLVLATDYQRQILSTLQKSMTLQILVLFTVITLIGISLIHFIIMSPLNRLVMNMNRIARGEYRKEVIVKRKDELGAFMHHFNHMAAMISSRTTELSLSRERLDLALEASEAGLWDWNIKTGEVIFNERWASMLGYRLDEIAHDVSTWEKLLHPDDKDRVMECLERHLKGEVPLYRNEHRLLCRDNTWIWILDTGKVVQRDMEGNPERATGTHIDINKQKLTESDLEHHRNNLESLVKERTRELEETQKELVNKAVEAGRAQLSAMVLHNIGNAITPVSVNTEKLKNRGHKKINRYLLECYNDLAGHREDLTRYITDDPRGIQVAEYMGTLIKGLDEEEKKTDGVIDSISAGIEYVSRILSLQRTYAPEKSEMKERVNLNVIVEDALNIQESAITKRNIRIEKRFLPGIPGFPIEKNKLMQVLVNFIKNSCDAIEDRIQRDPGSSLKGSSEDTPVQESRANPEGKGHWISLTTFRRDNRVGVSISDSGCGVEQERQQEIFEFGISSKGSSGFGLYYCKSFVEANNGTLTLKSDGRDQGTAIVIEFPASQRS